CAALVRARGLVSEAPRPLPDGAARAPRAGSRRHVGARRRVARARGRRSGARRAAHLRGAGARRAGAPAARGGRRLARRPRARAASRLRRGGRRGAGRPRLRARSRRMSAPRPTPLARVLVQASSRSWKGAPDPCLAPLEGRPALVHTLERVAAHWPALGVTLVAPAFDRDGPFAALAPRIAPGRLALLFAHDADPLARLVDATADLPDDALVARCDGQHP